MTLRSFKDVDAMGSSIELADSADDVKADAAKSATVVDIRASPPLETEAHEATFEPGLKGRFLRFKAERPVLYICLQAGVLCLVACGFLVLALKALLPPIDADHRDKVRIPKNFESLKDLNDILQIYKERHFVRVLSSFCLIYLFLQAFSLPGSMYLSILAGAMYGLWALPLVCFCVASGASLCYGLSALFGPALLLASAKWRNRLAVWKDRIQAQRSNLISYLIVLRIAPLPPHWVVNLVAPHLSINLQTFWLSTFFGVAGVTFIHVSIGETLSQMTSSSDFHLISLRNFLVLAGVVAAALVPVLIRYAWKSELADAVAAQSIGAIALTPDGDRDDGAIAIHYNDQPRGRAQLVFLDDQNRDLPARQDHARTSSSGWR